MELAVVLSKLLSGVRCVLLYNGYKSMESDVASESVKEVHSLRYMYDACRRRKFGAKVNLDNCEILEYE